MELYNRSAMSAILDMQISRFFLINQGNPSVLKKIAKIGLILSTEERSHRFCKRRDVAAILDMQIS